MRNTNSTNIRNWVKAQTLSTFDLWSVVAVVAGPLEHDMCFNSEQYFDVIKIRCIKNHVKHTYQGFITRLSGFMRDVSMAAAPLSPHIITKHIMASSLRIRLTPKREHQALEFT